MKLFFGIFSLFIITIGVQGGATKIEIFEIRENDDGLQLKNLNTNPINNRKPDPLLKLLRGPKSEKTETNVVKFAKNLIKKLKSLRGEEKTYKQFNDDTHVYILNTDDDSSNEKTLFIDKTRNDRATNIVDKNDIENLLLQLLQPERKIPYQRKRKLRQKQVLRSRKPSRVYDGVLSESRMRAQHPYEYNDNNDGQNSIDKDDQ